MEKTKTEYLKGVRGGFYTGEITKAYSSIKSLPFISQNISGGGKKKTPNHYKKENKQQTPENITQIDDSPAILLLWQIKQQTAILLD